MLQSPSTTVSSIGTLLIDVVTSIDAVVLSDVISLPTLCFSACYFLSLGGRNAYQ